MNTRAALSRRSARRQAGFTMAEIAIALGVIAVALIAIIGILPAGLQGQRDTREETIINQDARLLLEAIRTGGRTTGSELTNFLLLVNGVPPPGGFTSRDVVQWLSELNTTNRLIFSAISGGIGSRGSELGFRYQVSSTITNHADFSVQRGVLVSNQMYEVRLRFSWPIKADGTPATEANRYVVRTLISGLHVNSVFYVQEYFQPATP